MPTSPQSAQELHEVHDRIHEVRERIAKIEVKVDYIIDNMSSLPPSPETIKRLEKIEEVAARHSHFEEMLNERIAWITGAFTIIAAGLGFFGQLIWDKVAQMLGTQ